MAHDHVSKTTPDSSLLTQYATLGMVRCNVHKSNPYIINPAKGMRKHGKPR